MQSLRKDINNWPVCEKTTIFNHPLHRRREVRKITVLRGVVIGQIMVGKVCDDYQLPDDVATLIASFITEYQCRVQVIYEGPINKETYKDLTMRLDRRFGANYDIDYKFYYGSLATRRQPMKEKRKLILNHQSVLSKYHRSPNASSNFIRSLVIRTKMIFENFEDVGQLGGLPYTLEELIEGLSPVVDKSLWSKY